MADPSAEYFWKLPAAFTGNQLEAYGGQITFTLRNGPEVVSGGDSASPLIELKVGGTGQSAEFV